MLERILQLLFFDARDINYTVYRKKEKQNVRPSLFTRKVFFSSAVRKPLVVVFALLFFQQFSGIDAIIFFTVEIFQKAGNDGFICYDVYNSYGFLNTR